MNTEPYSLTVWAKRQTALYCMNDIVHNYSCKKSPEQKEIEENIRDIGCCGCTSVEKINLLLKIKELVG